MRFILFLICLFLVNAQDDSGFIYGKITMRSGDVFTGAIQWGEKYGKELYWIDTFDATKPENRYDQFLSRDELREIRRDGNNRNFWSLFESRGGNLFRGGNKLTNHQFSTAFGNIKSIQPDGSDYAYVKLKNGEELELEGSGDIGATILILDENGGREKLKWRRIDLIEFMETPEKLKRKFGNPLFATVETAYKTYEGLIQWDYEECLDSDELNGDDDDFLFERIHIIEKNGRRSVDVTLYNGRNYRMSGTNDVNSSNRGIVMKDPIYGKIEIPWNEFKKATFKQNNSYSGPGYSSFKTPSELTGTIELEDGNTNTGRIVFDLDESLDLEMLDGEIDDIKYSIPMRSIKKITPRGNHGSIIELKNGESIELYDSVDVSNRNDGILLFKSTKDPEYYSWNRIKSIELK